MRCLLLISSFFGLLGCSSAYRNLQPAPGDPAILQKFKPAFSVALYRTSVDAVGNHLSGILLVKQMPDSSMRLVFSNEIGVKFFDFEFSKTGSFKVFSIVKDMDKKPVIKTLRKDFELVLMKMAGTSNVLIRQNNGEVYYTFHNGKDYYHYITDQAGNELLRMERSSKRKVVMESVMKNYINGVPDTIGITHKNFSFTIGLKRIER